MSERRSKYNARKVTIDGYTFDSAAEARRYRELKLLMHNGDIQALTVHPKYVLQTPFYYQGKRERGITYEADFSYLEDGFAIVEDVKGIRTAVFNLKRKFFLAMYGGSIDFRIVKA